MVRKRLSKTAYYLIATILALIAMVPFFWMISTSFKSRGTLMNLPIEWIPSEPTLDAYRRVFTQFPFGRAIFNSLFIAVSYTLITLVSSSMAAFAFAKLKFPFADGLFKLYLASMMIPTQVTLIPLFVIMRRVHLINTYGSVIFPALFRAFAVFLLVQTIRSIPDDYLEAARLDGAGLFRTYWQVVMPLCAPTLATLCITTFMDSWNDFLWPLVMLSDRDLMTLPLALSTLNGQYGTEYNVLMAGSLLSMLPIILVFIFAQKQFKSGLMAGGVKG
jgi:multiple sugar transport system permease protein